MANLSQTKRERMLEFLDTIRQEHRDDDDVLAAINEIETELNAKKYGLVWEQHEEAVDVQMRENIPVFTECEEKEIIADPGKGFNFLLEGDNLHSLRLLEKTHRGKIDVIYIDPPYNTENDDFIYEDTYVEATDSYRHSKWLSFMSERLAIARKLLSHDGVIAISIGYHEVSNLMLLCQEIFNGRQIMAVTVQTSGGKPNGSFNVTHEYLVLIAPQDFVPNASESSMKEYSSPYHGMTLATFNQVERPNQTYPIFVDSAGCIVGCGKTLQERIDDGSYTGKEEDFVFDYDEAPVGSVAVWPVTTKGEPCVWRLIPSRLLGDWEKGYIKVEPEEAKQNDNAFKIQYLSGGVIEKIENGELESYRIDSEGKIPTIDVKNYKTAAVTIPTIWTDKEYYTSKGSKDIREIFDTKIFTYPKPVTLLMDILERISNPDSIVLDFFAGSGTTAQAVLNLNAIDDGKRRFILCTNNESNICEEVTYERCSAVIKSHQFDHRDKAPLYKYKIRPQDLIKKDKKGGKTLSEETQLYDEIENVKEEQRDNYDKFATEIDDNHLCLYGIKTYKKDGGIPANLKYYRTDFVSKQSDNVTEELLAHIKEMVQLEHGIKLDGHEYLIVLDDEEADRLEKHWDEYPDVKAIYVARDVLFTTSQRALFSDVEINTIPDYYFEFELQELGEAW